jgi:predicted lipoprotein with Yx(FWY)xxD motif
MKRIAFLMGTAVVGLATLTACGGAAGTAAPAPQSTPSQSAPASTAAAGLSTATVGNLGQVVVDGTSRTLYVFGLDTAKPSMSNCNGSCAAQWPPVPAGTGTPKVSGVAASLVGTVTRSDGTKQLTLAGAPLYYFASDAKAGDANGQDLQAFGATWWVVGANGQKITTPVGSNNSGY